MTDALDTDAKLEMLAESVEDLRGQLQRVRQLVDAQATGQGELRLRMDAIWQKMEDQPAIAERPAGKAIDALDFDYDPWHDVLTIEGIRYSGDLFRGFGVVERNRPFVVTERNDGVLTLVDYSAWQAGQWVEKQEKNESLGPMYKGKPLECLSDDELEEALAKVTPVPASIEENVTARVLVQERDRRQAGPRFEPDRLHGVIVDTDGIPWTMTLHPWWEQED